jgi:hypothetical protein
MSKRVMFKRGVLVESYGGEDRSFCGFVEPLAVQHYETWFAVRDCTIQSLETCRKEPNGLKFLQEPCFWKRMVRV